MNARPDWYNAARVSQPGSVVLNSWIAGRPGASKRAGIRNDNFTSTNLTLDELSNLVGHGQTWAGVSVSEKSSLSVSTVYACVALIAGAISTLPLPIYQRTPEGRERVDHDYWWALNERPNPRMSAAVFWEYLQASVLMLGDGFAEIRRPNAFTNRMSELWPLHPDRVQVLPNGENGLLYIVTPLHGPQYTLTTEDVLHIPGLGFDGLRGLSVVRYAARQGIGTALAAEEFSARFFGNGARPDYVLKTDKNLGPDQAEDLRQSLLKRYQGASNSHLPAVLTNGLSVEKLSMSAEDAQLIATRGFQVEDICRFFGVPPHMVGHTDKTTSWGSGVENMGRGFVKFTLSRHLGKIEQELNHKLWPTREKLFVEFNVAGLERGDLKSENEALRIALGRAGEPGWMTQDEVRRVKNLKPMGGAAAELSAITPAAAPTGDQNTPQNPPA